MISKIKTAVGKTTVVFVEEPLTVLHRYGRIIVVKE